MAKKFVRGITDIKTINNQDLDTNNVNDLLSDGKHNYIHRKKSDGSEEYHNLTNNIKTLQSDDTDLLTVTNYNNTTNSATIRPKHDSQKEQLLESTDDTILISHGENGTDETTSVDVNPEKVLEHENLLTGYGISKTTSGNNTTLALEYTKVDDDFDLNDLRNGYVRGFNNVNAPETNEWFLVSAFSESGYTVQQATKLVDNQNTVFKRTKQGGAASWTPWSEQVWDKSEIDSLLAQKEQVLESTDNTILITHGENGTEETTSVDVNPAKVLQHVNLLTDYGITKTTSGNTIKLGVGYSLVPQGYDLNNLINGRVRAARLVNAPDENTWFFVSAFSESDYTIQDAIKLLDNGNKSYRRLKYNGVWGQWREQVGDKSAIDTLLSQKQNTLTSNASIAVDGSGLRQLYTQKETYTHANATLKTHVKSVANSSSVSTVEEEFNFLAKMNRGERTASFTLNAHDAYAFRKLIDTYGEDHTVVISGCMFSMDDDTSILSFMCNHDTTENYPYALSFSDIIDPSQDITQ